MRMRDILNIITESVAGKSFFVPEENAYISFADNRDADVYLDYVQEATGERLEPSDMAPEKVVPAKTLAAFYGTPNPTDEAIEERVQPYLFGQADEVQDENIVYVPEEDAVLCFEDKADLEEFEAYVKDVSGSPLKKVTGTFRGKKVPSGTIFLGDGNRKRFEELVRPYYVYRKA